MYKLNIERKDPLYFCARRLSELIITKQNLTTPKTAFVARHATFLGRRIPIVYYDIEIVTYNMPVLGSRPTLNRTTQNDG